MTSIGDEMWRALNMALFPKPRQRIEVYLEDFGIYGDGVTDNTAALPQVAREWGRVHGVTLRHRPQPVSMPSSQR